jgi:hypothetical protein
LGFDPADHRYCKTEMLHDVRTSVITAGLPSGFYEDVSHPATIICDPNYWHVKQRSPRHMHASEFFKPRAGECAIKSSPYEHLARELVALTLTCRGIDWA